MEKMVQLFEEFLMKAILMTEDILNEKYKEDKLITHFTENRDRLLNVIYSIAEQIDWNEINPEATQELNRMIDYIKALDVKLLTKLQEHQIELKKEIETTYKQKETLKGYDQNSVK